MNNTAFQQTKQPKRPTAFNNDSILEALRDLSGGVGKTVTRDVAGKVASDALASLLGAPVKQGELRQNEVIDFPMERQPRPHMRRPEIQPAQKVIFHEDAQIKQQLEAVRAELSALSKSMHLLNTEIQKAVAEAPVMPGIYHVTFYEKLRSVLAMLREQIDDSRTWLALSAQRKQKKLGYWGMFKKHGTTFGLSNERSIATSAG
ncbi:MAG: DUF5660 domain-containing protein [Candidatus Gottesmanbacteria bacterium]|nr:DUF5660 domain-containing protein [Candidatus Gottesmanbacteria bacterium]